jgi:hypothetical protein
MRLSVSQLNDRDLVGTYLNLVFPTALQSNLYAIFITYMKTKSILDGDCATTQINPRAMLGSHQRIPATAPTFVRGEYLIVFGRVQAISCVVAIQTRPIIGSLASTDGAGARYLSRPRL